MSKLTVKDISAKKHELENEIAVFLFNKIKEFQDDSGGADISITVNTMSHTNFGEDDRKTVVTGVELRISI